MDEETEELYHTYCWHVHDVSLNSKPIVIL